MDTIGQFIDECVFKIRGYKVGASVIYQVYKNWAIMNGQYVMSGTKFGVEFFLKNLKNINLWEKFFIKI